MNRNGGGKKKWYGSPGYESEPIFISDESRVLLFSDFSQEKGRVIDGPRFL
jgi:hypothetical protein